MIQFNILQMFCLLSSIQTWVATMFSCMTSQEASPALPIKPTRFQRCSSASASSSVSSNPTTLKSSDIYLKLNTWNKKQSRKQILNNIDLFWMHLVLHFISNLIWTVIFLNCFVLDHVSTIRSHSKSVGMNILFRLALYDDNHPWNHTHNVGKMKSTKFKHQSNCIHL